MMADQPPLEAVIDQPGVAIRALQAETAGATQSERRVAAAVEEQHRLPGPGEHLHANAHARARSTGHAKRYGHPCPHRGLGKGQQDSPGMPVVEAVRQRQLFHELPGLGH